MEWEFKGWRIFGAGRFDEKVEFETNLSKGWCWDIAGKSGNVGFLNLVLHWRTVAIFHYRT
jgi:hypothetical protein